MNTEKQDSTTDTQSGKGGVMIPCPFCGSSDLHFLKKKSNDGTITWVQILHGPNTECSVSMIDTSEERVVSKWNLRYGS